MAYRSTRRGKSLRQPHHARVLTVIVLLLLALPSQALEGWSQVLESPSRVPLTPQQARIAADGSIFLVGYVEQDRFWWQRYDASLQRLSEDLQNRSIVGRFATGGPPASTLTVMGSWTQIPQPDSDELCRFERTIGFELRSISLYNVAADPALLGRQVAIDALGGIPARRPWTSALVRLRADCSQQLLPGVTSSVPPAAITGTAAAYVLDASNPGDPTSLARVDSAGVAWRVPLATEERYGLAVFATTPEGDALIRAGSASGTRISRYAGDGSLRWRTQEPLPDTVSDAIADGDGAYLIALDAPYYLDSPSHLVAIDASGRKRWQIPFAPNHYIGPLDDATGATPALWILFDDLDRVDPITTLVRPIDTGGIETVATLARNEIAIARVGEDSLLLHRTHEDGSSVLEQRTFAGVVVRQATLDAPRTLRIGDTLIDGSDVFVASHLWEGRSELRRYSRSGALEWSSVLPPPVEDPAALADYDTRFVVRANAERVCLWRLGPTTASSALACVQRADGQLIFGGRAPPFGFDAIRSLRMLPDNTIAAYTAGCAVSSSPCTLLTERVTFDAEGALASRSLLSRSERRSGQLHASTSGQRIAIVTQNRQRFVSLIDDETGALRWQTEVGPHDEVIAVADDGSVAIASPGADAAEFGLIDPQGNLRWRVAAEHLRTQSSQRWARAGWTKDGDVLMLSHSSGAMATRLRALDGSVVWSRGEPLASLGPVVVDRPGLTVPADSDVFHITFNREKSSRVLSYRQSDGAVAGALDVAPTAWRHAMSHLDPPRDLLVPAEDGGFVVAQEDPANGNLRIDAIPASRVLADASVRVDASLLGTWYAPDASGQGLFFDLDGDASSAFGAWFTYEGEDRQDVATQRWYTLAAARADGEAAVAFTVYSNRGGRFAQGPATDAVAVGHATLYRLDCDRAVLDYRFDAGTQRGGTGRTPLLRIGARTRPCADADGGDPATPAQPARGLDPRSSGAWYDPSASGQGIAFDLRPPQGDDAGFFAGAWFTYDIDGTSDDPTAQHWFSLAGDLSGASDGRLSVPIVRTIGSALDAASTSNSWRVGTATLQFSTCDTATLIYAFDDIDVAHHFAGRTGNFPLRRVGGCGD